MGFFSSFRGTWALLISLVFMLLGNGLQGTLLGIRGANEGFSTLTLSLVSTGYYIGYFTGSFIVPRYIKSIGYIRVFATLVAIASVAAIFFAMLIDSFAWFSMRFITGFCFAGIYMVAESWLNSATNNENRGKVLGVYVISIYVGLTLGQVFINFGDINTYYLFAVTSIAISVAAIPLLLTPHPAPQVTETKSLSIKKLYQKSPLGVVSTFLSNFMIAIIIGLSAVYAQSVGMSTQLTSIFVSAAYIGCVIFQYPIGFLADRMDRRRIIIILSTLGGVTALIAALQTNPYLLVFLFFLLGGLLPPIYSLAIAYVNDRLEPEEVLPATSALLIISGLGSVFSPFVVGLFMTALDPAWFFGVITVAALTLAGFAIYRTGQSDVIEVDELGEFSPVGLGTTAATMSLSTEDLQTEFDFTYPEKDDDTHLEQES